MSFFGDLRHTPAATKPPGTAAAPGGADPSVPLRNLSAVQSRMDNLQKFLSDSINSNSLLGQCQMDLVSSEITSAIHQIIVSGGALLSCTPSVCSLYGARNKEENEKVLQNPDPNPNPKVEIQIDDESDDYEIIEMDAVELLAEHVHFCEICGKGFKRDANLRMHMRAHGNQFKTLEALVKPEKGGESIGRRRTRFSCPFVGCNRNKLHKKFKPLKSAICVKNHFKRSHCPKMYSCNRCNKKSFSVVSDLKSHLKHCGESKWKCSCGTSFSRKDKLFGHMALFEGHMPAVMEEGEEETGRSVAVPMVVVEDDDEEIGVVKDIRTDGGLESNDAFLDGVLDEFGSIEDYSFEDVLNSTNSVDNLGYGMEGFFNFDG